MRQAKHSKSTDNLVHRSILRRLASARPAETWAWAAISAAAWSSLRSCTSPMAPRSTTSTSRAAAAARALARASSSVAACASSACSLVAALPASRRCAAAASACLMACNQWHLFVCWRFHDVMLVTIPFQM